MKILLFKYENIYIFFFIILYRVGNTVNHQYQIKLEIKLTDLKYYKFILNLYKNLLVDFERTKWNV